MNAVNTTLLEEELAPLNAQIEETLKHCAAFKDKLRVVEEALSKFSTERQKIDALGEVHSALTKLKELKAEDLFWEGLVGNDGAEEHLNRVNERVNNFEVKIKKILDKQALLQKQVDQRLDDLDDLYELARDAHEREERRLEEFVIEREISDIPFRVMIMPWTKNAESERRFRRFVLAALVICFIFGAIFQMVTIPIPEHEVAVVKIPERLAKLVKKEPPKPMPPPKKVAQKAEESPVKKSKEKSEPTQEKPNKVAKKDTVTKRGKKAGGGQETARRHAERVGVLAFKKSFAGLMDETPIAKLGSEARISKTSPNVAGQAVAQRSLVAMQAKDGTSGGIGFARVSRNVGSGNGNGLGGSGIGRGGSTGNGAGFENVESAIADIEEESRPLSDGVSAGRTDEEIQIVFDRYKATLYRIYNRELRKDPTLRGKILLRISIKTNGEVSMCKVESTDLQSPELVAKIVERIKRFNFGPKEDVPTLTILYPIDFLPAG